jgi:hypothetical protein
MKLSRKNRLSTALILLISVLFTQFAVAVHVCPGMPSSNHHALTHVRATSDVAPVSMSDCCPEIKQSALCLAHCQDEKQSINKAEVPTIAPLLALGFVLVWLTAPINRRPHITSLRPRLKQATAPPLSILNCCFRI